MFSTLLICATSVLLGISEVLGRIRSKPINFFLSAMKKKKQPNQQTKKTHTKKEKAPKPHKIPINLSPQKTKT